MAGNAYAIKADVKITAPFNAPLTPAGETTLSAYGGAGEQTAFGRDILSITITNSTSVSSGRFSIEVVPRRVLGDKEWVDIIKPYSMVSIAFQRIGDPADPATNLSPDPMIVGIVDRVQRMDDFGDASPNRSQRIMGRALTGVLEDHRYWFHHLLAQEGFAPADYRDLLPSVDGTVNARDEVALRSLGLFAIKPELFFLSERRPSAVIDAGFQFFVRGQGEDSPPFIKLFFSDGRELADRLVFDGAKTQASYFDQRAALPRSMVVSQLGNSSLFDVLRASGEERPFTEVFSETVGTSHTDAKVELIVRKPPFAGHIRYDDSGRAAVGFATSDGAAPKLRGQTLFDATYGAWIADAETVAIDNSDVVAVSSLSRGVEAGDVFTLYFVAPAQEALRGGGHVTWKHIIPPIIEEDPDSPSYIKRFGVRPFDHEARTIAAIDDHREPLPHGDIGRRCLAYATLAREWFYRGPEFWRGSYVLKGRTSLRAGKRLVDVNLSREYYITGVSHRMTFGEEPSYLTTVAVERGWDLDDGTQ